MGLTSEALSRKETQPVGVRSFVPRVAQKLSSVSKEAVMLISERGKGSAFSLWGFPTRDPLSLPLSATTNGGVDDYNDG